MPEVPPSIFDQVFLQETRVRRRELMPKALKIYVWLFMILPFVGLVYSLYFQWRYTAFANQFNISLWDPVDLCLAFIFPAARVAANIFIWLEKRWAILGGLITDFIFILSKSYSIYLLYANGTSNLGIISISVIWLLIDVPYVMMLLKIKKSWEQKGYAVNELSDIYVK